MKKTISIEGMVCGNCVKHVEEALHELSGVSGVDVSLENKNATVTVSEGVDNAVLEQAIVDAGYEVKGIV